MNKVKRRSDKQTDGGSAPKKLKKSSNEKSNLEKTSNISKKDAKPSMKKAASKHSQKENSTEKPNKWKHFKSNNKFGKKKQILEKPADWKEYKKKMKEVRIKRKKSNNLFETISKAKKISEKLRQKKLKGGKKEREELCTQLHELLGNQGIYPKLILSHDMARVIQYLIKFGNMDVRRDIAKEMSARMVELFQSKYAKFCITRLLKYGDAEIRSRVIQSCYGSAVKLSSHAVSSSVFNYAFSTWATPAQKRDLAQEFYGEIYNQSKDVKIKHLRDVYSKSPDMNTAILGATKANLQRVLNKELLDSHLVQIVLAQFLQECSVEDRAEIIGLLNSHLAILSNSKEGSRAAMICIWQGSKKDRKVAMKSLKEHVLDLCKHEYGHCTIITLLDSADDTVLLNKIILQEILKHAGELIENEWGRKVISWLVAPGDMTHFHPVFLNELKEGKEKSEAKKDTSKRREEILNYVRVPLLQQLSLDFQKWFSDSAKAMVALSIIKAGSGDELKFVLEILATFITDPEWKVKEKETEIAGIEHAGYHMVIKKLIKYDESINDPDKPKFGEVLVEALHKNIIKTWITSNRPCFLLVYVMETNSEEVQKRLAKKFSKHLSILEGQTTPGAKLLFKKIKSIIEK